MMEMMSGMWGMMTLAIVLWALVVVAFVAGVWAMLRRYRPEPSDTALATLRERYARGEISREEFEAGRRDLAA